MSNPSGFLSGMMGGGATGAVGVQVDTSGYLAALRAWWPNAKMGLGELMKSEANLMAEALMMFTPPFGAGGGKGLSGGAKNRAQRIIASESKRVFRPMWEVPMNVVAHSDDLFTFMLVRSAGRFRKRSPLVRKLLRDKDPDKAFEVLKRIYKNRPPSGNPQRIIQRGALSKDFRNQFRVNGRVMMKASKNQVYYLENYNVKDIDRQVWLDIGKMKAQWAYAAAAVSGSMPTRTPEWVRRHSKYAAKGVNRLADMDNPSLELVNGVANKYNLGSKFNVVQEAFNVREKKLVARLKSYISDQTRAFARPGKPKVPPPLQ
jgi:hypothetical protein